MCRCLFFFYSFNFPFNLTQPNLTQTNPTQLNPIQPNLT